MNEHELALRMLLQGLFGRRSVGVGDKVTAMCRIEQSPLSNVPAVPRGAIGVVEGESNGYIWVDFDAPYGVVCCDPREIW